MNRVRVLIALLALGYTISAQAEAVPFDSGRWQFSAQEHGLTQHLGREALKLQGGLAWLPDVGMRDGTVTFDMAFSGDRGFSGLIFRMVDEGNYEHFYLRPHRSGHPDANQYTPVFNRSSGWQLYFGPRYSAQVTYPFDEWFPVKIVISGNHAVVYIQDMEQPALFLPELKRKVASGSLGLNAANFAPAWFSNFRFDPVPEAITEPPGIPDEVVPEDYVKSFEISNTFDAALIEGVVELNADLKGALTWSSLEAEPPGFVNIARLRTLGEGNNTAFARLVLDSQAEQTTMLKFGYSDSARVYLNDRLLYAGDNTYESRDFRYLGTIGLFDAVALHLEPGRNEVLIAVTEAFGGWGVMARLSESE